MNNPSKAAYHEAGHAIMAWNLKLPLRIVKLHSDLEGTASLACPPSSIEAHLRYVLAGPVAEALSIGLSLDNPLAPVTSDLETVVKLAMLLCRGDRNAVLPFLKVEQHEVKVFFDSPEIWCIVKTLARELELHREFTGIQIQAIIDSSIEPSL